MAERGGHHSNRRVLPGENDPVFGEPPGVHFSINHNRDLENPGTGPMPVEETGPKAGKKDIFLMVWINFLSFVCFAIVLPSLWPYLSTFGVSKSWVGWAVAVNSAGTFVASPILGKWADKRGAREAIFVSLVIMIVGNFLYAIAMNVWVLLAARFIVGCAAANYAPASAYLSYATSEKTRTLAMGLNSAAGILGFILGPAIAAGLTFIPDFDVWKAQITENTSPGWASIILTLVAMPFLITFNDIRVNQVKKEDEKDEELEREWEEKVAQKIAAKQPKSRERTEDIDPEDEQGLHSFGLVDQSRLGIPSSLSSLTRGPYDDPDDLLLFLSPPSASLQDPGAHVQTEGEAKSNKLITNPMLTVGSTKSIKSLKKLAEPGMPIVAILVCLYLQFAFYTAFTVFETIGTPYTQSHYGWSVQKNGYLFAGIGAACILAIAILQAFSLFLRDRTLLLGTQVLMLAGFGLLVTFPFDDSVNMIAFLVGVFAASIGFSAACALLIAIFSKLLADQEQGLMMGYLSTAGSAARIIGPLAASYTLDRVGGGLVFALTVGLLLSAIAINLIFYGRLVTKGAADYMEAESNAPINESQRATIAASKQRLQEKEDKRKRRWDERNKRQTMATNNDDFRYGSADQSMQTGYTSRDSTTSGTDVDTRLY